MARVEHVRANGQRFFYDEAWSSSSTLAQIEKCRKIAASDLADAKCASKLYGVVVDDSPAFVGLLYH